MPPKMTSQGPSGDQPRGGYRGRGGDRGGDRGGFRGRGGGGAPRGGGGDGQRGGGFRGSGRGGDFSGGGRGGDFRGGPRGRGGPPFEGHQPSGGGPQTSSAPPPPIASTAIVRSKLPEAHVKAVGVKRTSFGTRGTRALIYANHYELQIKSLIINQYDVSITPKIPGKRPELARELFRSIKASNPGLLDTMAYSGAKISYAPKDTIFEDELRRFQVTGPESTRYTVAFLKTREIDTATLKSYIQGQSSFDGDGEGESTASTEAITCLNVVLGMPVKEKEHIVSGLRSFFDRNLGWKDLGLGLEVWRGIFHSARPGMGRMTVNVDITAAIFYKAGPLIDLIQAHKRERNIGFLEEGNLSDADRRLLNTFLAGCRIKTTYNGRIYFIDKLADGPTSSASSYTFKDQGGKTKTIQQHFLDAYNIRLKYPKLIMIKLDSPQPIFIPLELCTVRSGEMRRAQPPPELMKGVVQFTTMRPNERRNLIQSIAPQSLEYSNNPHAQAFGFNVIPESIPVESRILPPPTLLYGPKARPTTVTPRAGEGKWQMPRGKTYYQPQNVSGWVIGNFDPSVSLQEIIQSVKGPQGLFAACANAGITGIGPNNLPSATDMLNPHLPIQDQLANLGRKCRSPRPFFLIVLPSSVTLLYTAIKNFARIKGGYAIQCVLGSKLREVKPGYFDNLALKINCKLAGVNFALSTGSIPLLRNSSTIVLGADAVHPPPAPGKGPRAEAAKLPSFNCVVASLDSQYSRYTNTVSCQSSGRDQEIIHDMKEMVKELIKEHMDYKVKQEKMSAVAAKPKTLIMFRDGVGEKQFTHVIEREVPDIRAACKDLGLDVKITYLVVGKRHHTRLFPTEQANTDRSGNCPAGTVVDTGIVDPVESDFYLLSHAGLQGTSRPAHYNPLVDDNNLTADEIQEISNAMAYVYQRTTRSVSIPAPTYYADSILTSIATHFDPPTEADPFNYFDTYAVAARCGFDKERVTEEYKRRLQKIHRDIKGSMYWQ